MSVATLFINFTLPNTDFVSITDGQRIYNDSKNRHESEHQAVTKVITDATKFKYASFIVDPTATPPKVYCVFMTYTQVNIQVQKVWDLIHYTIAKCLKREDGYNYPLDWDQFRIEIENSQTNNHSERDFNFNSTKDGDGAMEAQLFDNFGTVQNFHITSRTFYFDDKYNFKIQNKMVPYGHGSRYKMFCSLYLYVMWFCSIHIAFVSLITLVAFYGGVWQQKKMFYS